VAKDDHLDNVIKTSTQSDSAVDTIPLADALRAASILSEGTIAPEDALCRDRPWLVDAGMVLLAHQRLTEESHASTSWMSLAFPELRDELIPLSRPKPTLGVARMLQNLGLPAALSNGVLFGTADALVSDKEIPPLLPPIS
jgi:hypothetical protein